MRLTDNEIKQIKQANDIVEVIGERLDLVKKGSNYGAVCPWHDDHDPSMTISKEKQIYTCWVCQIKGEDVINFVSRYDKITWIQAARKLAQRAGIQISQASESFEDKQKSRLSHIMELANGYFQYIINFHQEGLAAKNYLANRNINDDIINQYHIGLSSSLPDSLYQYLLKENVSELDMSQLGLITTGKDNKNYDMFRSRIMIPIYDHTGALVAFSGRIFTDEKTSKYINSAETPIFKKGNVLYNLYQAKDAIVKSNKIIICEGFMDVFACHQAGYPNVVATMGTALTNNNIQRILGLTKNIVLCFDGDAAGIHAMQSGFQSFATLGITPDACVLPDNMDPDEYLRKYGKDKLNDYLSLNTLSVIEWLYRLAKKNLNPNDFNTKEKFKNELFSSLILVLNINNTLIEHYLKQLSNDIDIDINTIKSDFDIYCKQNKQNNFVKQSTFDNNIENQKQFIDTPIPSSKQKIYNLPKKVLKAYSTIIFYLLTSPERIEEYFSVIGYNIMDDQVRVAVGILLLIKQYYEEMRGTVGDDLSRKITQRIREQSPIYNTYITDAFNGVRSSDNKEKEFKDCIKTIQTETIKQNTYSLFNKASSSNKIEDKNEYIFQKRIEDKCR